jgi:transcriptional regulator with XRE-family HTH domain
MNTPELQQLKMAWLAAKEAGDIQAQFNLLKEHPAEQTALIDFIAAYHATGGDEPVDQHTPLLDISQRAMQRSLAHVFDAPVSVSNIAELRKNRQLSKVSVAQGLRLSVDVWNKFEAGAIELTSLTQRQIERLAQFFQVSIDEFSKLLTNSQPSVSLNRRQTQEGARKTQQGPQQQSFAEAIARSTMSKDDRQYWLNE